MRTYDCFLFFNEFDLLELRLKTLDPVVDLFVLVESPVTFTGNQKPLYFLENKEKFAPWLHKIRHVVVDPLINAESAWDREIHDRRAISQGILDADPDDLIFISDCDEIWNPVFRDTAADSDECIRFAQSMHYYYLNRRQLGQPWYQGTVRLKKKNFIDAQAHRINQTKYFVADGGWHYSYIGDTQKIIQKLKSFAHTEYSTDFWTDPKRIQEKLETGDDLFDRGQRYETILVDGTFPMPVLMDRDRWRHLMTPVGIVRSDLLFSVPTLNRYAELVSLLALIESGTCRPAEYLIIDNGKSLENYLKESGAQLPPRCRVLAQDENIGVAAAWNIALEMNFKYTFIAGDDCIFNKYTIEKMVVEADKHPGPALFYTSLPEGHSPWACFMQNREMTREVGLYDERFWPGYFEDDDYRRRMLLRGLWPLQVSGAHVEHFKNGGQTSHQFKHEILWKNADVYAEKWGGHKGAEKVTVPPPIGRRKRRNKKLKIVAYTITKNEEKFIKRYCEAAKDADEIVIVDTGSTDSTVSIAREMGATVHQIDVSPWRFDVARNASLALLPADANICIAADADEVLVDGWREEIESVWTEGATRLRYMYDWGKNTVFMCDKIHARKGYSWRHPCHERLTPDPRINEKFVETSKLIIAHLPDDSKSRGQYLDLLSVGAKEDPHDPRNSFYYARELTFYAKWTEAIEELKRYLALPDSNWGAERAFAMRLVGKSLMSLGLVPEAQEWYEKSTREAPERRENWVELSDYYHKTSQWGKCRTAAERALDATEHRNDWPNDPDAWGAKPYDLLALSAYYTGDYDAALANGMKAAEMSPNDPRLQANLKWYRRET